MPGISIARLYRGWLPLLYLLITACGKSLPPPEIPGLIMLDKPLPLEPFSLQDQAGTPFTNASLQGKWSIAFFGYTHCPDVCPTTLTVMTTVSEKLPPPYTGDTRFVFITLDPFRDDAAHLKDYLHYFNDRVIGVTGDAGVIQQLASTIGVFYDYADARSDRIQRNVTRRPDFAEYLLDHTASLFFFDPQGRLRAYLLPPFDAAKIQEVYQALRA